MDRRVARDFNTYNDLLKGYEAVNVSDLKAGQHVRYVKKAYNAEKKSATKCVYAIVDSCEEGKPISMHSYVPYDSDDVPYSWVISEKNVPYIRFYRKTDE